MGTSTSVAEFRGKILKAGRAVDSHSRTIVERGMFDAKTVHLTALRAAIPDQTLKTRAGGGQKINVRYDVKGRTRNVVGLMRATGPAHIIERGAAPHYITPKGASGSRGSRAARLGGAASVTRTRRTRGPDGRRRYETVFALESDVGFGPAARGRITGGGRGAVLGFPGQSKGSGYVRRFVRHPGMKGKRFWSRSVKVAQKAASRHLYKGAMVDAVKAVFN